MIEQGRRAMKEAPVSWDDLRQRRVLGRIEAELDARSRRAPRSRGSRRLVLAVAGAAAVVLAALVALALARPTGEDEPGRVAAGPTAEPSLAATPAATPDDPPAIALADGSIAHLGEGARVEVVDQQPDLVRLAQLEGTVRYEVTPDPDRRFVVDAAGVEVEVLGTVFTVALADASVTVSVTRGRVAVRGRDRAAELAPGDSLRVELDAAIDEPVADDEVVVVDEHPPRPRPSTASRPRPVADAETLLARADTARAGGRLPAAAEALRELVQAHPRDPRAYSAEFQLGKVERARGRHAAAARAFAACVRRSPTGALSEDARAEAAVSWRDAGEATRAERAARDYLERYPTGAHAARMQRILDRTR